MLDTTIPHLAIAGGQLALLVVGGLIVAFGILMFAADEELGTIIFFVGGLLVVVGILTAAVRFESIEAGIIERTARADIERQIPAYRVMSVDSFDEKRPYLTLTRRATPKDPRFCYRGVTAKRVGQRFVLDSEVTPLDYDSQPANYDCTDQVVIVQ